MGGSRGGDVVISVSVFIVGVVVKSLKEAMELPKGVVDGIGVSDGAVTKTGDEVSGEVVGKVGVVKGGGVVGVSDTGGTVVVVGFCLHGFGKFPLVGHFMHIFLVNTVFS